MAPRTLIHTPPAGCPNDGICSVVVPRLEEGEKRLDNHDAALNRIGVDLDQVKREVHEIRVVLRERDGSMNFLRTVFLSILGVGLVQVASTLWWAATLTNKVEALIANSQDWETRMRASERERADMRNGLQDLREDVKKIVP